MFLLCPRWGINIKVFRAVTLRGLMDWWNVSEEPTAILNPETETTGSSDTLVPIYQTTWHHILEDAHI
jgi:hypothetical protein